MTHLAYVDCSNLFIEGQKVSAVARGLARSLEDAKHRGVIDFGYRLDLHSLMALLQQVADGFAVTVLYWAHASRELREAATAFHVLDAHIADLALG